MQDTTQDGVEKQADELQPIAMDDDAMEAAISEELMIEEERIERKIDRDLAASFPASDPPGWTMGIERDLNEEGA